MSIAELEHAVMVQEEIIGVMRLRGGNKLQMEQAELELKRLMAELKKAQDNLLHDHAVEWHMRYD